MKIEMAASNEKFCLRWNDFENNINSAFKELREQKDFFDVTLACDDKQIEAHKVILSACSPFFKTILRRNPHQHPLLYLHGVTYTDLQSVLSFMYHGEVSVAQEELNSFLAVAENLKVKGLTQQTKSEEKQQQQSQPITDRPTTAGIEKKPPHSKPSSVNTTSNRFVKTPIIEDEIQEVIPIKSEPKDFPPPKPAATSHQSSYNNIQQSNTLATAYDETLDYTEDAYDAYDEYHDQYRGDAPDFNTAVGNVGIASGQTFQDPSELLQFVEHDKSDISRRRYVCTICNIFYHQNKSNVRNHVECKHFPDSFVYNCEFCGSSLPSKAALQKHKHKVHRPI